MQKRVSAGVAAVFVFGLLVASATAQLSDWGQPEPLVAVNSPFADINPTVSKDGLSLYFVSNRPGGYGGFDIWVSQRASVDQPWNPPQNLGPTLNSPANEVSPSLSSDGHTLFFQSDRTDLGGFGGVDIYATRRHDKRQDFAWRTPVNLGPGVNSAFNEAGPEPFEDDRTGVIQLYFNSNRPGGFGGTDIYLSTLQPDETFGPALPVDELNTSANDAGLCIRRDGLELILTSSRPGGLGGNDLWGSVRADTSAPWSEPANLGAAINSAFNEQAPALSFDATELYFASFRTGAHLWVARRTKLNDVK